MKETPVAQRVELAAANLNILTMRNNVGVARHVDQYGKITPVRYGLMNTSKEENERAKSSDYIGICPVVAYVDGIGWTTLGVFTAIETKHSNWQFDHTDKHSLAQKAFHDIVRGYGGYAGFATGPDDVARIVGRAK